MVAPCLQVNGHPNGDARAPRARPDMVKSNDNGLDALGGVMGRPRARSHSENMALYFMTSSRDPIADQWAWSACYQLAHSVHDHTRRARPLAM